MLFLCRTFHIKDAPSFTAILVWIRYSENITNQQHNNPHGDKTMREQANKFDVELNDQELSGVAGAAFTEKDDERRTIDRYFMLIKEGYKELAPGHPRDVKIASNS